MVAGKGGGGLFLVNSRSCKPPPVCLPATLGWQPWALGTIQGLPTEQSPTPGQSYKFMAISVRWRRRRHWPQAQRCAVRLGDREPLSPGPAIAQRMRSHRHLVARHQRALLDARPHERGYAPGFERPKRLDALIAHLHKKPYVRIHILEFRHRARD